jgi:aldehyde:ferredoxin oxidoreductase
VETPGRVIEVYLNDGKITESRPNKQEVKAFLGGRGWNIYCLLKWLPPDTDPLSAENIIIFTPGILTGSKVYSSSRLHISSVSPLTGYLASSNVGGYFGARLMQNGIFSLIVRGRANNPAYIWIEKGTVEIRTAGGIWGKTTDVARDRIAEQTNSSGDVGVIGLAGENQVHMASIIFNQGHAAGRTGLGAVMGSKNLKAVGAGKGIHSVGRIPKKQTAKEYLNKVQSNASYEEYAQFGDSTSVKWTDDLGAGTVKNYRQVQTKEIESADGRSFKDLPRSPLTCFGCPIHCKALLELTRGPHKGDKAYRPSYEALVALGPKCGNFDGLETIHLNDKCNNLGLDSVEMGGLIAFVMDLYDQGKLTANETEGFDLSWGNTQSMNRLIEMVAHKEGWLGKTLSNGLKKAAQIIGRKAEDYAYHVKGLGMTAMDPRGFKGSALGYAIGSRGGDFTSVYARPEYSFSPKRAEQIFGSADAANRLTEKGKPQLVKRSAIVSAVVDSLGICKIPLLSLVEDYDLCFSAQLASDVLGEAIDPKRLLKIGKRIITAERLFNLVRGLTVDDDKLPEKFTSERIKQGPSKGAVVHLDSMLAEFYLLMGWDSKGIPTDDTLRDLGLKEFIT